MSLPRRPLTIATRRAKVVRAINAIRAAQPDWPLEREGQRELRQALELLAYVWRQLDD